MGGTWKHVEKFRARDAVAARQQHGEAPGAWVFVSEHVSPRHRNLACGSLSLGLLAGILLSCTEK